MKSANPERQPVADRVKELLQAVPGLRVALLYGSAATGKMKSGSDVDVAVLFDQPLNAEQKMTLTARLEGAVSRTVDLVDLSTLNGTILKQILCKGQVLIKKESRDLTELLRRMAYNQADMMPYVYRTLAERQERFIHG